MKYDLDMDTDVVLECANIVLKETDASSDFKQLIDDLVTQTYNLSNFWVSTSQVKTANELIASLNSLKALQATLNLVASATRTIAESRNELEKKISTLVND